MAKVLFSNEKIKFETTDKETIFHCSECGQMGSEAPIRSTGLVSPGKGKVSSYHLDCALSVINRIQRGESRVTEQKLNIPTPTIIPSAPPSRLRSVVDEELERKKKKLKNILKGDEVQTLALEAVAEKAEAKPKARIDVSDNGNIYLVHKFERSLVDKYHFIKQIKWNGNFKYWECEISVADFETCRFLFKIYKEVPQFDWLISEDAYEKIKARLDYHERMMMESKAIKEIKSKEDIDIDLSFLKLPPFPYQKVGIAFLDKIGGVGFVGDSMGLGKCILGHHSILTNLGHFSMEELFDNLYKKNEMILERTEDLGEWYEINKPVSVASLENLILTQKNISHMYRERVNTLLKKVTLADGSIITVTQPHKLLTLNGWNSNLKSNEYVLVPRKTSFKGKKVDERILLFLAWTISEGYERIKGGRFTITQNDTSVLKKIKKELIDYAKEKNIKINTPRIKPSKNTNALYVCSVDLKKHLEKEFGYSVGKLSAQKVIPSAIIHSTLEDTRMFLKNYFEAEGSVGNLQKVVEITSASRKIIDQLQIMLRRFGIWLRITPKQKMATNGRRIKRTYYTGIIGGSSLRVFRDEIGFISNYKNKDLKKVTSADTNDNVDIIPSLDLCQKIFKIAPLPESHTGINHVYRKNQNFSRSSAKEVVLKLERILNGSSEKAYRKLPRTKWTDQVLTIYENLDYIRLGFLKDILKQRLEANAFYSKIKSIEYVSFEGYVYDLTVPETHNYVSDSFYSHNTAQAIGFTAGKKLKTAVVCPASLKYNWKNEIEKFTDKLALVVSETDVGELDPKHLDYDYYIINYEQLKKYEKFFSKAKFQCVVLDESHYIKDLQSQRTKNVYKLFKKVPNRLLLSGTPIKNRPIEFYSQLKFLRPDLFSNKEKFALRYCDAKKTDFGWDYSGASNLEELNRKISNFYIRRDKKEVLSDLPDKNISLIEVEFTEAEKTEYGRINKDFYKFLNENWSKYGSNLKDVKIGGEHLSKMMELKQYCSRQKVKRIVEYTKEFLESSDDRKIIIFAQFIETQKALRDAFPGQTVSILGETKDYERQEAVDRFQKDPKIRVFVGSTLAAGIGLTLTAADTVVFSDLMWSPSDHQQAEDRAYRIGQKNNVQINYFVFKGSIEEMIWKTLSKKLGVITQVLDGKTVSKKDDGVARSVFQEFLADFKAKKGEGDDESISNSSSGAALNLSKLKKTSKKETVDE